MSIQQNKICNSGCTPDSSVGHDWAAVPYRAHHHRGCGFRAKKRWVHPQKCSFASLCPAGMLPGSALQTMSPAMAARPLLVPLQGRVMESSSGVRSSVGNWARRWAQVQLSPAWAGGSWVVPEAAMWDGVQHLGSSTAGHGQLSFQGFVPHCFLFCAQRQESWLWEQPPSLSWQPRGHNLWAASAIMSVPAATES